MDLETRYSTGHIAETASVNDEICRFKASWNSQFWNPNCVARERTFVAKEFQNYLKNKILNLDQFLQGFIARMRSNQNIVRLEMYLLV